MNVCHVLKMKKYGDAMTDVDAAEMAVIASLAQLNRQQLQY
jgi:hypothetical protein